MYFTAATIDDLMRQVYVKLLKSRNYTRPTRARESGGGAREFVGVLLRLRNPRARLSRTEGRGKLLSCIGELLWYLSRTDSLKFIEYYVPKYQEDSEDGKTVYGAYGERFFNFKGHDQIANVLKILREREDSRRAVIQIFDASDITNTRAARKHIPCTCTLQFIKRGKRLHLYSSMRSNDAYLGLTHDIFAFTMLQEILARSLDVDVGQYVHSVGSFHLYDRDEEKVKAYLKEGWQETTPMPPIPLGDPWPAIKSLLAAEGLIRAGKYNDDLLNIDAYWADLVRILQIFYLRNKGHESKVKTITRQIASAVFMPYLNKRRTLPATRK